MAKAKKVQAAAKKPTIKIRRRVKGNFMAVRSFRMSPEMLAKWDKYCDRKGMSRTELLRRFIATLPKRGQPAETVEVRVV